MVSQSTLDDTLIKPFVSAVWVALIFALLEDLPKGIRRALLIGAVIAGTLYLDKPNWIREQ